MHRSSVIALAGLAAALAGCAHGTARELPDCVPTGLNGWGLVLHCGTPFVWEFLLNCSMPWAWASAFSAFVSSHRHQTCQRDLINLLIYMDAHPPFRLLRFRLFRL